jgi:hypothetical protein
LSNTLFYRVALSFVHHREQFMILNFLAHHCDYVFGLTFCHISSYALSQDASDSTGGDSIIARSTVHRVTLFAARFGIRE